MSRMLLQVDDEHGSASLILDHELTDRDRALLDEVLEQLPTGVNLDQLLAALIRQVADEQAYVRVCAQRGLLL